MQKTLPNRPKKKKEAKELYRRIIANAKLEARKIILREKRALVDEVFVKAQKKLGELSREHYIEFLVKLIEDNATGGEELILSRADMDSIGKQLIQFTELSLANKEKDITVTLSEKTRDIKKGFILSKDRIELNFTFENLLYSLRSMAEPEVIKVLF